MMGTVGSRESVSDTRWFFGVVANRQSYINITYLLLAFPLGTFYFTFLVTSLSLGFGLLITLAGIPILLLVFGGSWAMYEFERKFTNIMLNERIAPASRRPTSEGIWARLKGHLNSRTTWSGMLYLLLRFPLGVATFTIAVTLVSVPLGLLTAPAWTWTSDNLDVGGWSFDPFPWSWILTLIGIPSVFVSLHLMNGAALVSGRIARVMLGKLDVSGSEGSRGRDTRDGSRVISVNMS